MITETQKLAEVLGEAFGPNYQNIQPWREGGTRQLFLSEWGPAKEKRVIKVDKSDLSRASPRARRHVERGCTTSNDIETLSNIPDAEKNGLMRLLDYRDLNQTGYGGEASVEPYFESQSLEELVLKEGALPREKITSLFRKIFHAGKHLVNSTQRLHRDPKPSNILVGTKENEGEIRITDYANAKHRDDLELKYQPTAGSVQVTDWQLMSPLTGREAAYDEQSEVFAYTSAYLYARRGKPFVDIDPDTGKAVVVDTGESLLDENGLIDKEKYERALEQATANLPRKERSFVRQGLTSDLSQRFKSLDELVTGFESFGRPNVFRRHGEVIGSTAMIAGTAALILGVAIGTMPISKQLRDYADALSGKEKEQERYQVHSEWNGVGPKLTNNLVELSVSGVTLNSEGGNYPRDSLIRRNPGEGIYMTVTAKEIPRSEIEGEMGIRTPTLRGRAYIQGLPFEMEEGEIWDENSETYSKGIVHANDFWVRPMSPNETDQFHSMNMGSHASSFTLEIPEGTPDGIYVAAVEIYEPTPERIERMLEKGESEFKFVKFDNPGRLLAFESFPIVVGNPEKAIDVGYINFKPEMASFDMSFLDLREDSFYALGHSSAERGVDFELRIPEENFNSLSKAEGREWRLGLRLPNTREDSSGFSTDLRTLEVIARNADTGAQIYYAAFPIQRVFQYETSKGERVFEWELARPNQSWSERLVEYRKNSYESNQESE